MAITTFEPGSDIALVGAVLPLAVAIGGEGLSAAAAAAYLRSLGFLCISDAAGEVVP